MTKISFDAAFDLETLQKKTTVQLREIWMNLCFPPSLKGHMIRDIVHFQKQHKSAILKLEDRRSIAGIESEFSRNIRGRRLQLSNNTQSLPTEGKSSRGSETKRSHNLIPSAEEYETDNMNHDKMDSQHHKKNSSPNIGFIKWITSSNKVQKKSDQDSVSISEKEVKNSTAQQQKKKGYLKSNTSGGSIINVNELTSQNFSNLDIILDGLDVIADRDKKISSIQPENSSEFYIRPPSKKVTLK